MGAQECQADGHSFGACFCVGTSSASTSSASASGGGGAGGSTSSAGGGGGGGSVAIGDAAWAKAFGGTSGAQVTSVAADSTGAVVVGGGFAGMIQLGTTTGFCPANTQCGFVAKLAPASGHVVWAAAFIAADASSTVDQCAIAIGPSDEVYVAGGFSGSVDFGTGPVGASGQSSLYVSRYDSTGARSMENLHYLVNGSPGIASANGAVVQTNGHLVLEGRVTGTIDFGSGAVGPGTYLVELSPTGNPVAATAFANTAQDSGSPVPGASTLAATPAGDLVLVGETVTGANLGCGPLPDGAAFVAGVDVTGACRFSNGYPNVHAQGVAIDPGDDGIVVAGYLANGAMLTIGPDALTCQGQYDVLMFRLGSAGEELWGKNFGDAGNQVGYGVAVDPISGDVCLTGGADGGIDFGGGTLAGQGRIFAALFESDATLRWASRFGGTSTDAGYACAFSAADRLAVGGVFDGTIGFPSKVIQSNGPSSGFVAAIAVP